MKLSVIIPTHNNAKILPICLERIFRQTMPKADYEVLMINDASSDETNRVIEELKGDYQDRNFKTFNFFENKGPAAARDLGILESRTPLLVFIQDDILVEPTFLEKHFQFHLDHPRKELVLIGKTIFNPEAGLTPFMKWLEDGHQFKFPKNENLVEITGKSYLNFYTPNLSLKREFVIETEGFDESLYVSGGIVYEDTELGYRLYKLGMRLYYDPIIKVLHHHYKSLESVCRLRFLSGQTARILYGKHPELASVFKDKIKTRVTGLIINDLTIKLLGPLAEFCEKRLRIGLLFWLVCRYYYNQGYLNKNLDLCLKSS